MQSPDRVPRAGGRSGRLAAPLWLAALPLLGLLALAVAAAAERGPSPKELMKVGVEAARQGLWREAAFRWERAVKEDAENPRLRNNLAVAYEGLGRLTDADQQYREARRIDPDSREIRDNQNSFFNLHPEFHGTDDAGTPAPPAGHS